MTQQPTEHLSAEVMQAFLDGETSREVSADVERHVESCARCRSEMLAWETLFVELAGVEEIAPSPDFQERVLAGFEHTPSRLPWVARIASWLGRRGRDPSRHVDAAVLQDFLEGQLADREADATEAHLHACRRCQREAASWRKLLVGLEDLPTFEPSSAFAERVMAHVRVNVAVTTAKPTLRERLELMVRSIRPETRRRVAALAGAAVTPAATLGLMAYVVLSHPLVTWQSLVSFAASKAWSAVSGSFVGVQQMLTESAVLGTGWAFLQSAASSPALVGLFLATVTGLTVAASWVLYRNVMQRDTMDGSYAR